MGFDVVVEEYRDFNELYNLGITRNIVKIKDIDGNAYLQDSH